MCQQKNKFNANVACSKSCNAADNKTLGSCDENKVCHCEDIPEKICRSNDEVIDSALCHVVCKQKSEFNIRSACKNDKCECTSKFKFLIYFIINNF